MAMNLQQKVRVIAYLPIGLAALAVLLVSWVQYRALLQRQEAAIAPIEQDWRVDQLRNYIDLATSAMGYTSGQDDDLTKERAKKILRTLSYGHDGYFYVYDLDGINLVHPRLPQFEGKDILHGPDTRVGGVIRDLLAKARTGGGVVHYDWLQPSSKLIKSKMGYVVLLDRWGWMLGTGLYDEDDVRPGDAVEASLHEVKTYARSSVTDTITYIVGISVLAVLLAMGLAWRLKLIQDEKRRPLVQRTFEIQEERRRQLAMTLHDHIAAKLELATGKLRKVQARIADDASGASLEELLASMTALKKELRTISHEVDDDEVVRRLGIANALRDYAQSFQSAAVRPIVIDFEDVEDIQDLTPTAATALYRVAQEALQNVGNHSDATTVKFVLTSRGKRCVLGIIDNGTTGFSVRSVERDPRRGIGLTNMRERVQHFGGKFRIDSRPGRTEVWASVPMGRTCAGASAIAAGKTVADETNDETLLWANDES